MLIYLQIFDECEVKTEKRDASMASISSTTKLHPALTSLPNDRVPSISISRESSTVQGMHCIVSFRFCGPLYQGLFVTPIVPEGIRASFISECFL